MKHHQSLLLTLSLAFACIWLTACATVEQGAYRTIGATVTLVDASMNGWGDYVRAGKATDAQQAQVRALYLKYQGAMRVAKVAIISLKSSPADEAQWLTISTAFSAAANELIQQLKPFVPSLQPK